VEEKARGLVAEKGFLARAGDQHERVLGHGLDGRVDDREVVLVGLVVDHTLVQDDLEHVPHFDVEEGAHLRVFLSVLAWLVLASVCCIEVKPRVSRL